MKKRIASLFLAIAMIATLGVSAMAATVEQTLVQGNNTGLSAANFKDLVDNSRADGRHWAWDSIDHVVKYGLFNGTSATTFAPQNPMTRAQFVVVVTRMENATRSGNSKLNVERVPTETRFTDVPTDMWCAGAVAWAEANGIVEGYSDNTFRPNQAISRAQIAAFVYRYVNNYKKYTLKGLNPEPEQFTDFALASEVFHTAINYCRTKGLILGFGDHTLRPNISVTRAQVAAILSRIILVIYSGGGGGGGGGNPTASTVFSKMPAMLANWGRAGFYGVKFIAVNAADLSVVDSAYGTAQLNNVALASGEKAVTNANGAGFSLTVTASEGYTINDAKVYFDPNEAVVDGTGTDNLASTAYTWVNSRVSMTRAQFLANPFVTVVVSFNGGEVEETATEFKFIAVDENGDVIEAANANGTANFYDNMSVYDEDNATESYAELKSNDEYKPQAKVEDEFQGIVMKLVPADGYEISNADSIKVFDTSDAEYDKSMTPITSYSLNGNDVRMRNDQMTIDGTKLKKVTVTAVFSKSTYGYEVTFDMPLMSGVSVAVDTFNSFDDTKTHWLPGGTPLKDALRLLLEDNNGSLGSSQADTSIANGEGLNGTINSAFNLMVIPKLRDGVVVDLSNAGRLKSMVQSMAGNVGANILNSDLSSGTYDTQILNAAKNDLNAGLTQVYEALLSSAKEAAGSNVKQDAAEFISVDGGAAIPASSWTSQLSADTFEFVGELKGTDLTLDAPENINGSVTLTRQGTNQIEADITLENVNVAVDKVSGTYTITIDAGKLALPMNTEAATPIPLTDFSDTVNGITVTYTASSGELEVSGSIDSKEITGMPSQNVDNQINQNRDQLPLNSIMEDILNDTVQTKLDNIKEQMEAAAKEAGATDEVLESLENNVFAMLTISNYLTVASNGNLIVVPGLTNTSGDNYRKVIVDFYDAFWVFNSDLYSAISDAGTRKDIMAAVMNTLRAKVASSGAGKVELLAEVLTEEQSPRLVSLYETIGGEQDISALTGVNDSFKQLRDGAKYVESIQSKTISSESVDNNAILSMLQSILGSSLNLRNKTIGATLRMYQMNLEG